MTAWRPRRQHRRHPYYKVQIWDEGMQTWRDERRAYDSVEEARAFIEARVSPKKGRVMVVEHNRRYALEEGDSAGD